MHICVYTVDKFTISSSRTYFRSNCHQISEESPEETLLETLSLEQLEEAGRYRTFFRMPFETSKYCVASTQIDSLGSTSTYVVQIRVLLVTFFFFTTEGHFPTMTLDYVSPSFSIVPRQRRMKFSYNSLVHCSSTSGPDAYVQDNKWNWLFIFTIGTIYCSSHLYLLIHELVFRPYISAIFFQLFDSKQAKIVICLIFV